MCLNLPLVFLQAQFHKLTCYAENLQFASLDTIQLFANLLVWAVVTTDVDLTQDVNAFEILLFTFTRAYLKNCSSLCQRARNGLICMIGLPFHLVWLAAALCLCFSEPEEESAPLPVESEENTRSAPNDVDTYEEGTPEKPIEYLDEFNEQETLPIEKTKEASPFIAPGTRNCLICLIKHSIQNWLGTSFSESNYELTQSKILWFVWNNLFRRLGTVENWGKTLFGPQIADMFYFLWIAQ